MRKLANVITRTNAGVFHVCKFLVFLIAALMIYEVVARYFLSAPTSWAPELAALLFGPFFLLGGPYLLHTGGHVAVDLLSAKAKGRWAQALSTVALLLALIFGAILLYFSGPLAWQSIQYGETSYSSWNPILWPAKSVLPIAAALLILQAIAELIVLFENEGSA